MDFFFSSIFSLHCRIAAQESKANSKLNEMNPVTKRIYGKVKTNPLFPKFLTLPLDFPPSYMNFVIWRPMTKLPSVLPTLVCHTVAVFLLHKEKMVWKRSQCLLHIRLFPIITLLVLFLSPAIVVFSQELGQMLIQLSTVNALVLMGQCQEKSLTCCSLFSGPI